MNHLGIIMDGNRRFAKRLMLKPWKGHEWGAKKTRKIIEWSIEAGIQELTLYALSIENFTSRPKDELEYLLQLFEKECSAMLNDEEIMKQGIKVNIIGQLDMLPKSLQKVFIKLMEKTCNNSVIKINIAVAYGGRQELVHAMKNIAKKVKEGIITPEDVSPELIEKHLYLSSDPDLIIRTGGNHRTSNFLIWQSSYAEFMFIDKFYPEIEKEDFLACLYEFNQRERRFGK